MIFLVVYDRQRGRLQFIKAFDDEQRVAAEDERLDTELRLHHKGESAEVVLLEAANEEALRRTHRRYFEDFEQLVRSGSGTAKP